uniref:Uncharacterized protein n=1 Tax=Lepeophtheirus salmonis TaxID=72036 RepID=A0A0K2V497_LEPSM
MYKNNRTNFIFKIYEYVIEKIAGKKHGPTSFFLPLDVHIFSHVLRLGL